MKSWLSLLKMVLILHPQSSSAIEKSDSSLESTETELLEVLDTHECDTEVWIIRPRESSREHRIYPTALKMDQLCVKSWQLSLKPPKGEGSSASRHTLPFSVALAICLFFQRHTEPIIVLFWHFRLYLDTFFRFCTVFQFCTLIQLTLVSASVKWWAQAIIKVFGVTKKSWRQHLLF